MEKGSGEPLVLIGGGLTGWQSWIPHAEALAPSRRVIRLQPLNVALGLAGDPLPPAYSIGYEVQALRTTLDDLGLEQADLAAWSYGAAISLSFAIHNPQRVRSLTLIEPPAYWVMRSRGPLSQWAAEQQDFHRALSADDISEGDLIRFTHFAGLVPDDVDPRTLPVWPGWLKHRQSLRFRTAPFDHQDEIELVRAFEKPVLLVKGEEAPARPEQDIIDILAEEFPHAELATFPGQHAPHIMSMRPFMDVFERFLAARDDR